MTSQLLNILKFLDTYTVVYWKGARADIPFATLQYSLAKAGGPK
jgi:hypothetical protein